MDGVRVSNAKLHNLHLPPEADRYLAEGDWPNVTIIDALAKRCINDHQRIAVVDRSIVLTFADLAERAQALACNLHKDGIRSGDVISIQLPNWHETVVLILAASILGAVINPIVPIYRDAEVGFILYDCNARLFVSPSQFRNFDHAAMAQRLKESGKTTADLLSLRASTPGVICPDTIPVGGDESFPSRDPNDLWLLMYTSGTTGRAKAVMHSSNTLAAELKSVIGYWSVTSRDVILMPSPLSHITGYLYGVELPLRTGAKVVLMDRWDAKEAIDLIERHGVTMMVAATPFLAELIAAAQATGRRLPTLRLFACGGAPVAPELVYRAHDILKQCVVTRVYGSTEAPTVTLGVVSRSEVRAAAETEGRIVGHEVRLVDDNGNDVAPGGEGEVVTRGPELFLGYLNPDDERNAYTPDGFFRTGDLARLDEGGMLIITGRKKDLIIRGGENISPKEIEDKIFAYPGVQEVTVVAMPSERMGETACAFVVATVGISLTPEVLSRHISTSGLARQKWPERYFLVDELPKTASGKVRKDLLRTEAKTLSGQAIG